MQVREPPACILSQLVRLINKLKPGTITKINEQRMPFKQMENIEAYLTACKDLGIAELESFNTVDLYEEKSTYTVCCGALSQ